jgi:hypothetical protein
MKKNPLQHILRRMCIASKKIETSVKAVDAPALARRSFTAAATKTLLGPRNKSIQRASSTHTHYISLFQKHFLRQKEGRKEEQQEDFCVKRRKKKSTLYKNIFGFYS